MALTPLSEVAISLPFKIDGLGQVGLTLDQEKIWADRVRSVIGTAFGQRVYRPGFGCNAALGIFSTEQYVLDTIERDIEVAFSTHLALLSLESVTVSVNPDTQIITAEVTYFTPSGLDYSVRLGIASINGTEPISEEFAWQNP